MLIKALNNLDKQAQYTFLIDSYASAIGTLGVKNINSFPANWAIQLGKTGEEQTEIQLIGGAAPSGTSIVLAGSTSYEHPADTPVYAVKFNQLVFKRSTSGTAGTATAMTNGTVNITPDSQLTVFDDTTGLTSYAYRVCYYNSVTADVSTDSDWLTPSGYTFYSLQRLRERIKNKLYSTGYLKSDDSQLTDWVNEWMEKLNNAAIDVNQDYSLGSTSIAYGTNGLGTITDTDFKEIRRIWFTQDGSNYYASRKIHITDIKPAEVYNDTNPYHYLIGDRVFAKVPTGTSGTASIYYYTLQSPLTNDTDEIPICMRGYTKSFTDYGLSQAYILDGKMDEGKTYLISAETELQRFKQEISPRSKTGPTYITMSDAIDADDNFWFV